MKSVIETINLKPVDTTEKIAMQKAYRSKTDNNRLTIALILLVIAVIGCFSIAANAQKERDTTNSADKTLKSNARVNPSTLAMEMEIPLGGNPGRAGTGLANNFSYSSKVWQFAEYGTIVNPGGSEGISVVPFFARNSAAGWTSSLAPPRIEYPDDFPYFLEAGAGDYEGSIWSNVDYGASFDIHYLKRMNVVMGDGSSHEFRASDTPIVCGSTTGPLCNGVDMTGTYLSVDGSKMRLEVTGTGATLFMPNGTRILFGHSGGSVLGQAATTVVDVHGNTSTYNDSTNEWTDTMGRTLENPLPENLGLNGFNNFNQAQTVGDQVIEIPGLDSETLETTLSWRYLKHPSSSDPDDNGLGNTGLSLAYPTDFYCTGSSYTTPSITELFTNSNIANVRLCNYAVSSPGTLFNPIVLTKITLANGQAYEFKYNIYGEIEKIIYPSGAYERFVYDKVHAIQVTSTPYDQINRGVTDRYVSVKGDGSDEQHWEYGITRGYWNSPAPFIVTTTNPDGTSTQQYLFDEDDQTATRPFGFNKATTGRPYDERVYSSDTTPVLLSRKLTVYDTTGPLSGGYSTATRNFRPTKEIAITFEPGNSNALATMTETVYDTSGNSDQAYFSSLNAKEVKTYNYVVVSTSTATSASPSTAAGWFSSGDLATVSETDFLYDSNYKARNIVGLATETRVKDAAGNVKAKTQFTYDETAYDLSSSGSMPGAASGSWVDPEDNGEFGATVGNKRGRVTTVKNYYDISNSYYVETHTFYDNYGNVRKVRDGRGNDTETLYDDDYAFAYPTKTISPIPDSGGTYGLNDELETTTTYDFNTGLPLTVTDPNGGVAEMEYDDPLYRPTKVIAPNAAETITAYGAGTDPTSRWVKVSSQINATDWKEAYSWYDGLGRTFLTQGVDDAENDVFAITCFDSMGRVSKSSNPVRLSAAPTCASSLEWTTPAYDDLGRTVTVTTPDSAVVETTYGLATSGSQIGTFVTVEDQASILRRSITNALGQLVRVDEPDSGLGSISSPNQATTYAYDKLNNLTGVTQGSQTRSFTYDALSRLKEATNPESGTVKYTYDENSNVKTKWDARGFKTIFDYDRLNRVWKRCYKSVGTSSLGYTTCATASGETAEANTPDVTYYYDNVTNAKGKLTKVSSSVSTTEYTAFDVGGQVTQSQQTTDGIVYGNGTTDSLITYSYNLAGDLVEQQYPSGRVAKNTYDTDGSLSQIQSKLSGGTFRNFANSFSYTPDGEVERIRLGNGRWEMTTFNSRRQATMVGLGYGSVTPNLLKLDYNYGTTANNGSPASQTITVPGLSHPFVQSYTYDALDRLTVAEETQNSTPTWKQTFTYDRYGNRRFVTGSPTTILSVNSSTPKVADPEALATNNRFKEDQDNDSQADYAYNNVGNVTLNAAGHSFTYDAENRQITATGTGLSTAHSYNGNGKRVKSYNAISDQTTIYVYDASDDLIAEYTIDVPAPSNPTTSYLTEDAVGSVRAITDAYGQIKARRDFLPFGEEIYSGIASRNTAQKYSSSADDTKKKFATYQRDVETGLDYAQSRYYSPMHGRFTSPDEFKGGPDELFDFADDASDNPTFYADLENPQSLNKYQYAYNNPYKFNDPTGHCPPCVLAPAAPWALPAIGAGIAKVAGAIGAGAIIGGIVSGAGRVRVGGDPDQTAAGRYARAVESGQPQVWQIKKAPEAPTPVPKATSGQVGGSVSVGGLNSRKSPKAKDRRNQDRARTAAQKAADPKRGAGQYGKTRKSNNQSAQDASEQAKDIREAQKSQVKTNKLIDFTTKSDDREVRTAIEEYKRSKKP